MISFMVLGGERCGTTWAANWLTTDVTLCIHDPLLRYSRWELGTIPERGKLLGVACTGLAVWPNFVNSHDVPKVILHPDPADEEPAIEQSCVDLWAIKGFHIYYGALFNPVGALKIAMHLGLPFDPIRHAELCQMHIRPKFDRIELREAGVRELADRIGELLEKS